MLTIPPNVTNVKIFKIKNHLERAHAAEFSPALDPNMPRFRAICLEPSCGWAWKSDELPHEPRPAQDRAAAHRSVRGHRTASVFDILGQEDQTFEPRSESTE